MVGGAISISRVKITSDDGDCRFGGHGAPTHLRWATAYRTEISMFAHRPTNFIFDLHDQLNSLSVPKSRLHSKNAVIFSSLLTIPSYGPKTRILCCSSITGSDPTDCGMNTALRGEKIQRVSLILLYLNSHFLRLILYSYAIKYLMPVSRNSTGCRHFEELVFSIALSVVSS